MNFKGFTVAKRGERYREHRMEYLMDFPRSKLIDFIERCRRISPTDMEIMDSWESHFRERDVPYVIVEHKKDSLVLFKERVA